MRPCESPQLITLIGQIYEAALAKVLWTDFLQGYASLLNSQRAMIWANDFNASFVEPEGVGNTFLANQGFDPASLDTFGCDYGARNTWLENPDLHHEGDVVTGPMQYPPDRCRQSAQQPALQTSGDIFYTAAAIVEKRHGRCVNITVVRPESAGAYGPEELAAISILMPHLQAGMSLHQRLNRLEVLSNTSTSVLDGLPFGVILLDARAHVVHANPRAEFMMAQSRLLRVAPDRSMVCTRPSDDTILQRLLFDVGCAGMANVSSAGGSMRLASREGSALQLQITPLPSQSTPFGNRTATAIFLSDTGNLVGSLSCSLRGMYGLTGAEARLTEALVNGMTAQEYADTRELSMHTVRTQIKTATAKVGATRQSDLVRIVLTGPAVLRWGQAAQ